MDKETRQMFELILQKLDNVENRVESMGDKISNLENRIEGMETRQDEIYSVAKSIEHSNTVRKAEIDNLTHKVSYVEGTISALGEVIEKRKAIQ